MITSELIRFLLAGGIAACVNFLSRIALSLCLPYVAAIVVAYVLGMVTAFAINRAFVFKEANNELHHQVFWFVMVNLVAVLQTLAISVLLADVIFPRAGLSWHTETVAHAFGVAVPVVTSYFGHKHFSFKRR